MGDDKELDDIEARARDRKAFGECEPTSNIQHARERHRDGAESVPEGIRQLVARRHFAWIVYVAICLTLLVVPAIVRTMAPGPLTFETIAAVAVGGILVILCGFLVLRISAERRERVHQRTMIAMMEIEQTERLRARIEERARYKSGAAAGSQASVS